ncbi:A2 inhibitor and Ly6 PLAUR domain-containing protein-like [Podarcis lilfordi]|uniref:A2 inhibitor and Ly6 PLAUR domain-containing protein-like n=1 Tax=Podarcis lilfordi TaxID=74358 RepID=A0AA35KMV1_9SAUR|nr:A2 inhibitor and Ly6 PLAUR domain-containing protein-like [Podarcis lilfordi]
MRNHPSQKLIQRTGSWLRQLVKTLLNAKARGSTPSSFASHRVLPINMKFLLGLFLFSVLLTTGASIECEICKGVNNCTSKREICPEEFYACSSSLLENSKVKDVYMAKGCANPEICLFGVIAMTDGNGSHIRQVATCCEEYACNPAAPILPERNTRANGKICPGCSSNKDDCSAAVTECIGSETYCVSYVTLSEKNVVIGSRKGCTRERTCTHLKTFDGGIFHDVNHVKNVQCTPAMAATTSSSPSPSPSPLSLPLPFRFLLLALLLMKLLL